MNTDVMITKGNLGVAGCLSIFWLFLSCATDCLLNSQLFPNFYRKRVKRLFILLIFLLSSFISVWYLLSEKWVALSRCAHRRVFILVWEQQHLRGNGGVCHQRMSASPIILTISKWLRQQWTKVNIHPILNVLNNTIRLPNSMVWIR